MLFNLETEEQYINIINNNNNDKNKMWKMLCDDRDCSKTWLSRTDMYILYLSTPGLGNDYHIKMNFLASSFFWFDSILDSQRTPFCVDHRHNNNNHDNTNKDWGGLRILRRGWACTSEAQVRTQVASFSGCPKVKGVRPTLPPSLLHPLGSATEDSEP